MSKTEELREALGMLSEGACPGEIGGTWVRKVASDICDTLGITREMVDHYEMILFHAGVLPTSRTTIEVNTHDAMTALLEVAGEGER